MTLSKDLDEFTLIDLNKFPIIDREENALLCPACYAETKSHEADNLHIKAAQYNSEGDYPKNAFGYRSGAVVVNLYCEGGHEFNLVLGDHKGRVYLSYHNVKIGGYYGNLLGE